MLSQRFKSMLLLVLLVCCGCAATLPSGPSVNVLPAPGKSFNQFRSEDAICRQWAERQLGMSPQDAANQNAVTGATVGTVIGAGAGALLGAASGHPGAGAALGAGTGLLFGTAAGAGSGEVSAAEAQRRYDNTYVQCMYSKGNQVPGAGRRPVRRHFPPPPPPPGY